MSEITIIPKKRVKAHLKGKRSIQSSTQREVALIAKRCKVPFAFNAEHAREIVAGGGGVRGGQFPIFQINGSAAAATATIPLPRFPSSRTFRPGPIVRHYRPSTVHVYA